MAMITSEQLKKMTLDQKYVLLKNKGDYLMERTFGVHKVYLYNLGKLYVEVWKHVPLDRIIWIEPVTDMAKLDVYLDDIQIKW